MRRGPLALAAALALLLILIGGQWLTVGAGSGVDPPGRLGQGTQLSPTAGKPSSTAAGVMTLATEAGRRYLLAGGSGLDAGDWNRVIVLFDDTPQAGSRLLADLGSSAQVTRRFSRLIHGLALRFVQAGGPGDRQGADWPEDPALAALRAHPGVRAVYPDARVRVSLRDSVPLIGAPQIWALSDGTGWPVTGRGVRVAIVDTGVDYTHPALGGCLGPGCKVAGGYDLVHNDGDPQDDHGHGTHVAGILAADGLLRGVAPGAELLAYKALDENGVGYASDVIAALEQAVAAGADVINLSLGAPGEADDPVSLAAQAAAEQGVVVVAAAGNNGSRPGSVESPAVAHGVIAVAAASKGDTLADFSGRGPVADTFALKPDLAAPGVEISATVPASGSLAAPGGWQAASGTSMAAPHVAGAAALLCQLHGDWGPAEVKAALMNYALDLGVDLFAQGAGRLDLAPLVHPPLLAVPGSLSFGLPLLDGTQLLTVTVRNLTTTTLTVTPSLALAHVADGMAQPISPTVPVTYGAVFPRSLALEPGSSRVLSVALEIPPVATDGYYQGHLHFHAAEAPLRARVAVAFALLSRATLCVSDETGAEIAGWGHMAVLARAGEFPFVVGSASPRLPAFFALPAGEYYAQAYGRFGLYDHLLIPGLPQQVPYLLVQPVTIAPHAAQTITLSLAQARDYWLDATGPAGGPVFVNAWAASLRHGRGESGWLTRLGQSYVGILNTDLPEQWPAGFPLRLSDTPPGITFTLALQAVGFSERYRGFVERQGSTWPAGPVRDFGFPLVGSADRGELLAWERPALDASTPTTFALARDEAVTYTVTANLPCRLDAPWLGWEAGGVGWFYPPSGARSGLEPLGIGIDKTWTVQGEHHFLYRTGIEGCAAVFHVPFYTPDWGRLLPWDEDQDVLVPDETALHPFSADANAVTPGIGPFYPALVFDNGPDLLQMRYPLLSGMDGTAVVWGRIPPTYTLSLGGAPVDTGTLPEFDLLPTPLRRWPGLAPGAYVLAVTHAAPAAGIGPGLIRAGFGLPGGSQANEDLNPPQLLGLDLPQRFDPATAVTVTWTFSDRELVTLTATARLGGGAWQPLAVELAAGQDGTDRYQARIVPQGAVTLSLAYTATDTAGNWLAWQPGHSATALGQVPVSLTFELDPPRLPWSHQPVTVRLVGSLLGQDGRPLAGTPAWVKLKAGGHFVGYVRDLTGTPGSYHTGQIDFAWTFVPTRLAEHPGALAIDLEFDTGLYTPQRASRTLELVPALYLPLIFKGSPAARGEGMEGP